MRTFRPYAGGKRKARERGTEAAAVEGKGAEGRGGGGIRACHVSCRQEEEKRTNYCTQEAGTEKCLGDYCRLKDKIRPRVHHVY